eukprot:1187443-Alexandrium_andersonii.AAC.1
MLFQACGCWAASLAHGSKSTSGGDLRNPGGGDGKQVEVGHCLGLPCREVLEERLELPPPEWRAGQGWLA